MHTADIPTSMYLSSFHMYVVSSGTCQYFLWASERSGFNQLYLYSYDWMCPWHPAVCCGANQPIGGGGHWVIDRSVSWLMWSYCDGYIRWSVCVCVIVCRVLTRHDSWCISQEIKVNPQNSTYLWPHCWVAVTKRIAVTILVPFAPDASRMNLAVIPVL